MLGIANDSKSRGSQATFDLAAHKLICNHVQAHCMMNMGVMRGNFRRHLRQAKLWSDVLREVVQNSSKIGRLACDSDSNMLRTQ